MILIASSEGLKYTKDVMYSSGIHISSDLRRCKTINFSDRVVGLQEKYTPALYSPYTQPYYGERYIDKVISQVRKVRMDT